MGNPDKLDETWSILKSIRILAMRSVTEPDSDFYIRQIFRWYSKSFFTPLHQVEELPLEDVLQAYYESQYERLYDADDLTSFNKELIELTETLDERKLRLEEEALEKQEMAFFQQQIEDEIKAQNAPKLEERKQKNEDVIRIDESKAKMPETALPNKKPDMPDIKIEYCDMDDLENSLDDGWDILGNPKQS